ncbi:MAG: DUF192 domain-containing protein [Ktedonobacterales bacterium]
MRYVSVVDTTTGETLAQYAAVAETVITRFFGLQGKRRLPPGTGLVLIPTSSIHMFFMRIRIDAIFVAADGRVLHVGERLRPWTIGPIVPGALYCVELPAGAAANTKVGHQIELRGVLAPGQSQAKQAVGNA